MNQNISNNVLFDRSLFDKILLYNRLSQSIVDESSVSNFQSRLTAIAKIRCLRDDKNWMHMFHSITDMQIAKL